MAIHLAPILARAAFKAALRYGAASAAKRVVAGRQTNKSPK